MTSFALPIPSATGSLDTYIQTVNRFPILTQEDETRLARRYRDHEDLEAAGRLSFLTCAWLWRWPADFLVTACRMQT